MSVRRFGLGLCLMVLVAAGAAAVAQTPAEEVRWLVVVQGQIAEFRPGTIILDAPPMAIAFTDRPERRVEMVDLRGFVAKGWGEGGPLRDVPPNASMVASTGSIAIIEITDAIYDNGQLTLWAILLEGEVPNLGDHVAITIDDVVNDQITD